tara:strand:+ start:3937 stop:4167 length:231 start_codon:yes stop_codon:yes gene_type:complete
MGEDAKYVFRVHTQANKVQIRAAVEDLFDVNVDKVNISKVKGKSRRFGRSVGRKPDWKKAVVTLRAGETIDLVPGV